MVSVNPFFELPEEIIFRIFGHLKKNDLINLTSVDRKIYELIQKHPIWMYLVISQNSTMINTRCPTLPNWNFYKIYVLNKSLEIVNEEARQACGDLILSVNIKKFSSTILDYLLGPFTHKFKDLTEEFDNEVRNTFKSAEKKYDRIYPPSS